MDPDSGDEAPIKIDSKAQVAEKPIEKKEEKEPKKQKQVKKQVVEEKKEQGDGDKIYIKNKMKWKDFDLSEHVIEALRTQNKHKPTKVQELSLKIALDKDRKKFNLLIRAINGSGKTLAFLVPMIASLQANHKCSEDKTVRGKLMKDQIFRPQGVIILRNTLLQSQLNQYLVNFRDYGRQNNVPQLCFQIGILNNDGHKPGDIIVCMVQSFLNRHSRGNMKLDKCKFIAIDEIDDLYHGDETSLKKLLEIIKKEEKTNLISCSATMQKKFIDFYRNCDEDFEKLNLNEMLKEENGGQNITIEGVKNFYKTIKHEESKAEIYDYIIKNLFKELFGDSTKMKPQIFMFFNSSQDIANFQNRFDALASDFTTDQSKYLEGVSRAAIAAKIYKGGERVELKYAEKQDIILKFRNKETNILMCTNIMARGVDIRNAVFVINVGPPVDNDNIDVDIYLHRVGRTGRHNDKGVALTIGDKNDIQKLVDGVKKVHKIDIHELDSEANIVEQVHLCIKNNE